jgi:hypothetical protein
MFNLTRYDCVYGMASQGSSSWSVRNTIKDYLIPTPGNISSTPTLKQCGWQVVLHDDSSILLRAKAKGYVFVSCAADLHQLQDLQPGRAR